MKYSNLLRVNWWVFVKCEPKSSQLIEPKTYYFSLCALNLFNTRVSQFELNYWNKWTFPRHSNLLRCTCTVYWENSHKNINAILFICHVFCYKPSCAVSARLNMCKFKHAVALQYVCKYPVHVLRGLICIFLCVLVSSLTRACVEYCCALCCTSFSDGSSARVRECWVECLRLRDKPRYLSKMSELHTFVLQYIRIPFY